jgi:hypothetical protein
MFYLQASDMLGSAWGSPQVVANDANALEAQLVEFGGQPMVGYSFSSEGRYAVPGATQADPWTVTSIASDTTTGLLFGTRLALIGGVPALAWVEFSQVLGDPNHVKYVLDDGSPDQQSPFISNGTPLTHAYDVNLMEVNGLPAVSYFNFAGMHYLRALDAEGTQWTAPIDLPGFPSILSQRITDMAVINGHPAIAYPVNDEMYYIAYVEATDALGDTWGEPEIMLCGAQVGSVMLAEIGGHPACAIGSYGAYSDGIIFAIKK